jgi:hypothetical protein
MKSIIISLLFLMSSGGSCEPDIPPFEYSNNTRTVIEAKLVNEDMTALANQTVPLMSYNGRERIIIGSAVSDANGKIFISAPKGNNPMYLEFKNKKILYATNYHDLIHTSDYQEDIIGTLPGSYYDFGIITLKNKK